MIREITILPGLDKSGNKESFEEITLSLGDTISIVGPTGSGKTAFINDIELLAQGDTVTKRTVLINGQKPSDEMRENPSSKPIAMITQNTKCFADLSTEEFLKIHARARGIKDTGIIMETIELANKFTGEAIMPESRVTVLSGGQTRSLLVADAILIGSSPIILLDEIENAGIFKQEVIKLIQSTGKIVIFVTHEPVIALLTKQRIIMKNGSVKKIISRSDSETKAANNLIELDKNVCLIRELLRAGKIITHETISGFALGGV